jgi:hypothetical protein
MKTRALLTMFALNVTFIACSRHPAAAPQTMRPQGSPPQYTEDDVRKLIVPGTTREAIPDAAHGELSGPVQFFLPALLIAAVLLSVVLVAGFYFTRPRSTPNSQ